MYLSSNTDEESPVFELVPGRTEQSNKLNTFRLESEGSTAHIRLSRHLDYESITEYILTVRIQVKYTFILRLSILFSSKALQIFHIIDKL